MAGLAGTGIRARHRTTVVAASFVGVLAVLLSACGGSASSSTSTTAATTPTLTGCTSPNPSSGTLRLAVGGHERTVIVHLPTGYSPPKPISLVLNLHGSGSTALEQEGFSGMDATADADGFIVAYPQGLITSGSGYDWNVPGEPLFGGHRVPADAPDDVTFLTALVAQLERRYCVDARLVYATGFSGGARMASQLACDASTVVAAVAPVSGLRHPTPCPAARAVPVVAFHGTADPVDPYGGNGQAYWTYSVPAAASAWAKQNGCRSSPSTSMPSSSLTVTTFGGCRDGSTVELDTILGEGHEWPGGPHLPVALTRGRGPQSDAVDANSTMWSFFVAHPMPVGS